MLEFSRYFTFGMAHRMVPVIHQISHLKWNWLAIAIVPFR